MHEKTVRQAQPLRALAQPYVVQRRGVCLGLSGRRRRPVGLASVRRSNGPYSFPVGRFHIGIA